MCNSNVSANTCICSRMLTDHIFTQESDGDPSLIIALCNEATLGNIMRTNHCLIPPLRGPPVPLPHTTAIKTWMRNLVFANAAAPARMLEPDVSPNPPMVYHGYIMTCTYMYMHEMLTCTLPYTKIVYFSTVGRFSEPYSVPAQQTIYMYQHDSQSC